MKPILFLIFLNTCTNAFLYPNNKAEDDPFYVPPRRTLPPVKKLINHQDEYILTSNGSDVVSLFNEQLINIFYYKFYNLDEIIYIVYKNHIMGRYLQNTTALIFSGNYMKLTIPNISPTSVGIYKSLDKTLKTSIYTPPQCKKSKYGNKGFAQCTFTLYASFIINPTFTWKLHNGIIKRSNISYKKIENMEYAIINYNATIDMEKLDNIRFITVFTYRDERDQIIEKKLDILI
jgi:hypothetical protein